MSDRMTPLSFEQLMNWILKEKQVNGTVFGLREPYQAKAEHALSLFSEKIETPFGPAAGPHTQLAQNLIAAYYAGCRFFELKTVQKLDGEDLPVSKPCIKAEDEGYNVEWSTELYVPQAFEEYVKAWFAIHILAKEYSLGAQDGFVFNMSVGYDLEGIQTKKIDDFIEGLKDAEHTPIFKECKTYALSHLEQFEHITAVDIEQIPGQVCTSITLSTLHGCPPQEIERIATYLLSEKHLHTFIKCNPTLLGYEFARKTLDEMGYDYIAFSDFHFKDDLQYQDAVPMLERLMALAEDKKLSFGVKITNTFPVDIKAGELPGNEMYMSGRSLYPLSITLAARLSEEFHGRLRISYSGGADIHNIEQIFDTGIWPITMATTVLKPGGYARFKQIAYAFEQKEYQPFTGIDAARVKKLAENARIDAHHTKALKPLSNRKIKKDIPLLDCFMAPCEEGCPIHQDITTYMELVEQEKYADALKVIMDKNPLPFTTGTICAHRCMSRCTRNFYDAPVGIRQTKLVAAQKGYEQVLEQLSNNTEQKNGKIAILGGGPAGLSAAYFLTLSGYAVTVFCDKDTPGGVVKHVIPEFRITGETVDLDIAFVKKLGVEFKFNTHVDSLTELTGYDAVILALGAPKAGELQIPGAAVVNAVTFLADYKTADGKLDIGKNVVVIGGGNTAMDTARAAMRTEGVEKVSLVYRRTKRYMPADEEELLLAVQDGVTFKELLSPKNYEAGKLYLNVMKLGEPDATGRRSPVETGQIEEIQADVILGAVGEHVDTEFYRKNGLEVNEKGFPVVNEETMESSLKQVYVIGDGRRGPATVVEAIADARLAADAIAKAEPANSLRGTKKPEELYAKKGFLSEPLEEMDLRRCLSCDVLCENCLDVCPNRANVEVKILLSEMPQIIHVDRLCNECGNCKSFCPYAGAPYQDKFTLFANEADFNNSSNQGFAVLDRQNATLLIRLNGRVIHAAGFLNAKEQGIDTELVVLMQTICEKYTYLL